MTDADFYEDLAQFMTDSLMENGFIDAEKVATKVREHDALSHAHDAVEVMEKTRAKTIEACLSAMNNIDWDSEIEEGSNLRMLRQAVELEIKGVSDES